MAAVTAAIPSNTPSDQMAMANAEISNRGTRTGVRSPHVAQCPPSRKRLKNGSRARIVEGVAQREQADRANQVPRQLGYRNTSMARNRPAKGAVRTSMMVKYRSQVTFWPLDCNT